MPAERCEVLRTARGDAETTKKPTVEQALRLMIRLRKQEEVEATLGKYRWRGNLRRRCRPPERVRLFRVDIFQRDAASRSQTVARLLDPAQKSRIVF
jgi:hypothetical protein